MRRHFRFIEIKADERLEMLDRLGEKKDEAIRRMTALNHEISRVEELSEDYHIGASYFLKLKNISFDELWSDYLKPLLHEYIRDMYNELDSQKFFKITLSIRFMVSLDLDQKKEINLLKELLK